MGMYGRGRRDGTGPYVGSYRRGAGLGGVRKSRGEWCPYNPLEGSAPSTSRGYRTGRLGDIKPIGGRVRVGLRRRVRL